MDSEAQPQKFVNWKVIEKVLGQSLSGGVQMAMLLQLDGALLTVASKEEEKESSSETLSKDKIQAALIANIWKTFDEVPLLALSTQSFLLACFLPSFAN